MKHFVLRNENLVKAAYPRYLQILLLSRRSLGEIKNERKRGKTMTEVYDNTKTTFFLLLLLKTA
jgi:hypothetical protein